MGEIHYIVEKQCSSLSKAITKGSVFVTYYPDIKTAVSGWGGLSDGRFNASSKSFRQLCSTAGSEYSNMVLVAAGLTAAVSSMLESNATGTLKLWEHFHCKNVHTLFK